MDIRLEGSVDGMETAEAIPKQYDMSGIYLTAYNDPEIRAPTQAHGVVRIYTRTV